MLPSHKINSHNDQQSGFTLLEMVLVVFIMGTLATISLTFIENEDSQWRYDESLKKMQTIREAVVKVRSYDNEERLSGFVFDNGLLPPLPDSGETLLPLIKKDDTWSKNSISSVEWQDYGLQTPSYKNNTVSFDLTGNQYQLFKGYRQHYLPQGSLDSLGNFFDAWGLAFDVDTSSINTYQFSLNNEFATGVNKIEGFTTPLVYQVSQDDWSIPIEQLRFSIQNKSGSEIKATEEKSYQVALLVYQNTKDAINKWQTYYFSISNITIADDATEQYGPGENTVSWEQNSAPVAPSTRIPVGRHLIVLLEGLSPIDSSTIKDHTQSLILARSSASTINLTISSDQ